MDCKFDLTLLQDYVEGSIDDLEKIFVEEHIKKCLKCKKELTELKLLFWELGGIDEDEIELPVEVDKVRDKVIDELISDDDSGFGIKKLIELQKKNMENSNIYISFIPGKELLGKSLKKSSSIVYSASEKALKRSIKIIKSRSST